MPLLSFSSGQSSPSVNGTTIDRSQHLRAQLRFFFMPPSWKWRLKRQCPWKAWFQFLKTILLTAQLILFGIERQTHVVFIAESNITFHHLFVRGWESAFETLPYPRASGDFALYTHEDMMDSINYVVRRFNNLTDISVGLFDFEDHSDPRFANSYLDTDRRHIQLCFNRFKQCQINPSSHSYVLDIRTEDICYKFNASNQFDVEEFLSTNYNETINYCSLNYLTLDFVIHAIQLKNQRPFSLPDCYRFLVKVTFDNNARAGKIRQLLDSEAEFRTCNQKIIDYHSGWTFARRDLMIIFDCFMVVVTIISFTLCLRSLWQGHRLCQEVRHYFASERREEAPLKWNDLKVFYSSWYFLMIITDLMVIPGSIIKITILFKVADKYDTTGLLLGLSSLLSWISILRYFSFFRKYNLLFITVRKALPQVLRFLLCTLIIYCGFMFCGWIVLGPYHTKFRTLATTFETLFALINGDDMYTTFANLESESIYIWIFSEIYLYSFVCLFIFVVSSLVIALLSDAYETVKEYYTTGFPKSRLQKFSEEDLSDSASAGNWNDLPTKMQCQTACFPCFWGNKLAESTELAARDPYLVRHSNMFV